MNWKEFLKPDWKKIILTLGLFVLFSSISLVYGPICFEGCINFGFPYIFYSKIGVGFSNEVQEFTVHTNYYSMFIDVVIWYLFSCLIFWIYDKFKKKKKK